VIPPIIRWYHTRPIGSSARGRQFRHCSLLPRCWRNAPTSWAGTGRSVSGAQCARATIGTDRVGDQLGRAAQGPMYSITVCEWLRRRPRGHHWAGPDPDGRPHASETSSPAVGRDSGTADNYAVGPTSSLVPYSCPARDLPCESDRFRSVWPWNPDLVCAGEDRKPAGRTSCLTPSPDVRQRR